MPRSFANSFLIGSWRGSSAKWTNGCSRIKSLHFRSRWRRLFGLTTEEGRCRAFKLGSYVNFTNRTSIIGHFVALLLVMDYDDVARLTDAKETTYKVRPPNVKRVTHLSGSDQAGQCQWLREFVYGQKVRLGQVTLSGLDLALTKYFAGNCGQDPWPTKYWALHQPRVVG